jgi:hypothetical protein
MWRYEDVEMWKLNTIQNNVKGKVYYLQLVNLALIKIK